MEKQNIKTENHTTSTNAQVLDLIALLEHMLNRSVRQVDESAQSQHAQQTTAALDNQLHEHVRLSSV
jgi:hypothetical protein